MLLQAVREPMMTVPIADKIKVICGRRMHGGFKRCSSRVSDRPRRQSRMCISVVGGIEMHISVVKRAAVAALQELSIDHAGIGLEGFAFRNSIAINARYQRSFFGCGSFFFYD